MNIFKTIKRIPSGILSFIKNKIWSNKIYRLLFIVALALIGVGIFFGIIGKLKEAATRKSPIIELVATTDNEYFPSETIEASDFEIIAVHENGAETSVPPDKCIISADHVHYIGEETEITITYDPHLNETEDEVVSDEETDIPEDPNANEDDDEDKQEDDIDSEEDDEETGKKIAETDEDTKIKVYTSSESSDEPEFEYVSSISCTVSVKSKREELTRYEVGYPNKADVVAIIYSNGELAFVGEGDIMAFEKGDAPWLDIDKDDFKESDVEIPEEFSITGLSFGDKVTPSSINYLCYSLETLKFSDAIPSSVKSMRDTFYNCDELESMADMSDCIKLVDITEAYLSCDNLIGVCSIPSTVREAESAFEDCMNLTDTPDMSNADSLVNTESMFSECVSLVRIIMPPNAENLKAMFEECINLKHMPNIPGSAIVTAEMFEGCISMTKLTSVPKNVEDMTSMFNGCELISGDIKVNANPEKFNGAFNKAALATNVNLKGKSKLLDAIALTSSSGRVTVNGKEPNPDLSEYDEYVIHEIVGDTLAIIQNNTNTSD